MSNTIEDNLKEIESNFSELQKHLKNYDEKCPRRCFNFEKNEENCQKSRRSLNKIMYHCDKIYRISNRDDETKSEVGKIYGEGFPEKMAHCTYEHHEHGCMSGKCGATPGAMGHLSVIVEEINEGHKVRSSHQNLTLNNTKGDNIYA